MKKIYTLILALVISSLMISYAAPAAPGIRTHVQPDGSVVSFQLIGDEFGCTLHAIDGSLLTRHANGWILPATPEEISASLEAETQAEEMRKAARRRGPGLKSTATVPLSGDIKLCVILVQYSDVKFSTSDPQHDFDRFFNAPDYTEYGATGSAKKYYEDQSAGKFRPQFDIYGPVTMSYTRAKYSSTSDFARVVKDATSAVDSQVNFKDYDNDNDGTIDNVFIISAGQAGNYSGNTSDVWPHSTEIGGIFPTYRDSKKLKHYAVCGEIGSNGHTLAGIGTFVHEFSHVLGLADHYVTGGAAHSDYTPGFWDIMDWGSYLGDGNNGRTPCNMSAYERMALDWATPAATLTTDPATVQLDELNAHNFFVKLETGRNNDYFLLENREYTGWDACLPGRGMLIWHIDAAHPNLSTAPNNTIEHMAVDIVRADNSVGNGNDSGDPWPGSANKTFFGASSYPPMTRWESSSSTNRITVTGREITDITRNPSTGNVTFNFNGGSATNIISPVPMEKEYEIKVSAIPANGGSVSLNQSGGPTSAMIYSGNQCQLIAEPADGYEFSDWTLNGVVVSQSRTYTFTVSETTAGTYIAVFNVKKAPDSGPFTYSVICDPENGGVATVNNMFSAEVMKGEAVRFSCAGLWGYDFDYLTDPQGQIVSHDRIYTITEASKETAGTYTAHFSIPMRHLAVVCEPAEGGRATVNDLTETTVSNEKSAIFRAEAADGYEFDGWILPSGESSDMPVFTIQRVVAEHEGTYTARFRLLSGIENINENTDPYEITGAVIFDMQGRRLKAISAPGLYIVNGRKVAVTF